MSRKRNKKPDLYVYDGQEGLCDLLKGLSVLGTHDKLEGLEEPEAKPGPDQAVSTHKSCSICSVEFQDLMEQREHFKLDWHRFNVKQRLQSKPCVSEDSFEELLEHKSLDTLSLSGSESDQEEEQEEEIRHNHPLCFFQNDSNQILSLHKSMICNPKTFSDLDPASQIAAFSKLTSATFQTAVFMLGGGHFAGAIFRGKEAILHKTFHCYTVRAKQGGAQSSADNRSGGSHPKSAGSSLRRYNEMALIQHVQDIVKLWSKELKDCQLIFYRAASGNRAVLFGGKDAPLDKNDDRLRMIPFSTKRATFKEVQRVHEVLTSIGIHSREDFAIEDLSTKRVGRPSKVGTSPRKNLNIRRSKSRKEPERPLPQMVQDLADKISSSDSDSSQEFHFVTEQSSTDHLEEYGNTPIPKSKRKQKLNQSKKIVKDVNLDSEDQQIQNEVKNKLVTACKSGNVKILDESLQLGKDLEDFPMEKLLNFQFGNQLYTPLHLASSSGHKNVIRCLLENGADPSIKDKSKKVPYNYCLEKETRNVYRNFQKEHPDKYDYKASQIPPPLSEESENRQKEKKKAQKLAKKEKEKEKKKEIIAKKAEEEEKSRYLALSDREKRALAAERRLLAQTATSGVNSPVLSRCFQCGADISGKVPFEYNDFTFCSPKCVKEHRQSQKK